MQIAFSSVGTALRLYADDMKRDRFRIHHGVIDKAVGSKPNEVGTFRLKSHMSFMTEEVLGSGTTM